MLSSDDLQDSQTTAADTRENLMVVGGINRYLTTQGKMVRRGVGSSADTYKHLIKDSILSYSDRVEVLKVAATKGRGARNKLISYLSQIPSLSIAYITLSTVWNRIATEDNRRTSVCALIGSLLEDEFNFLQLSSNSERLWKRLQRYAMDREAYHYQRLFVFSGARKVGWEPLKWTTADKVLIGLILIKEMEDEGLLVTNQEFSGKRTHTHATLSPSPRVLDYLQSQREAAEMGDLPMISPIFAPLTSVPQDWTSPNTGGYHHIRVPLVKLGKAAYTDATMARVYDAVNTMQRTAWAINPVMLQLVQRLWQEGSSVGSLPRGKAISLPEQMPPEDWQLLSDLERSTMKRDRREIHETNRKAVSDLVAVSQVLSQAHELLGSPVYLPYQLDYRGRAYAMPLLNHQGPDWMRSLFEFRAGKPIGSAGAVWLAIQVATLYDATLPSGVKASKAGFAERYHWTTANEHMLRAVVADHSLCGWQEADKPFMFLRSALEWVGYLDQGEEFVSTIPIALDGSCSGIQHYSALLRDEQGGASVNLTPSDVPADVYGDVARVVLASVEGDEDSTMRTWWLDHEINRRVVKKPVMTYGYSSRLPGFTDWYETEFVRPATKASKLKQESGPLALYLARKTLAAVQVQLIAVAAGMEWMITCARLLAHEGKPISWVTPIGFPVVQRYEKFDLISVETVLQGERLRVRVPGGCRQINKAKQANAISPNHTHSLDAAHLMLTVLHARDAYGVTDYSLIHDSFGTLAADTDSLFAAVREAFVDMYEQHDPFHDLWQSVTDALSEKGRLLLPPPPPKGTLDIREVLSSLYAFA